MTWIIVGVLIVCLLFILLELRRSVEGWEDQDGFHRGIEASYKDTSTHLNKLLGGKNRP